MSNRRSHLILGAALLAGLIAIVGIIGFQLGQRTMTARLDQEAAGQTQQTATAVSIAPAATALPIITNTPTATRTPTLTPGPTATPSPTPTDTPSPTPTPIVVITHVNALGRLETAKYAMRTEVNLENEPTNIWENIFGTDKLTLMAEGEVVAGIDFNKIKPADIVTQGTTVKMILPAPEILYSRIDNERTSVYERRTGLFRPLDKTLESRARVLAEKSLTEWAVERGIYDQAKESGRLQIENLLRSLGFTDITLEFETEPDL